MLGTRVHSQSRQADRSPLNIRTDEYARAAKRPVMRFLSLMKDGTHRVFIIQHPDMTQLLCQARYASFNGAAALAKTSSGRSAQQKKSPANGHCHVPLELRVTTIPRPRWLQALVEWGHSSFNLTPNTGDQLGIRPVGSDDLSHNPRGATVPGQWAFALKKGSLTALRKSSTRAWSTSNFKRSTSKETTSSWRDAHPTGDGGSTFSRPMAGRITEK
jgi:hypothetical protein